MRPPLPLPPAAAAPGAAPPPPALVVGHAAAAVRPPGAVRQPPLVLPEGAAAVSSAVAEPSVGDVATTADACQAWRWRRGKRVMWVSSGPAARVAAAAAADAGDGVAGQEAQPGRGGEVVVPAEPCHTVDCCALYCCCHGCCWCCRGGCGGSRWSMVSSTGAAAAVVAKGATSWGASATSGCDPLEYDVPVGYGACTVLKKSTVGEGNVGRGWCEGRGASGV